MAFEYVPLAHDGQHLAVIRVHAAQQRPIFLRKAYGKLRPSVVYVRRGSSTAEADPEEIARMGAARVQRATEPALAVQFGRRRNDVRLGLSPRLVSLSLVAAAEPSDEERVMFSNLAATLRRAVPPSIVEVLATRAQVTDSAASRAYKIERALLSELHVLVENVGTTLAEDVRVQFDLPAELLVRGEKPERPIESGTHGTYLAPPWPRLAVSRPRSSRWTDVAPAPLGGVHVEMRLGKIQPGASSWSEPIWIGAHTPCEIATTIRVFADNLPKVIAVDVAIAVEVKGRRFDDFVEPPDDDEH